MADNESKKKRVTFFICAFLLIGTTCTRLAFEYLLAFKRKPPTTPLTADEKNKMYITNFISSVGLFATYVLVLCIAVKGGNFYNMLFLILFGILVAGSATCTVFHSVYAHRYIK